MKSIALIIVTIFTLAALLFAVPHFADAGTSNLVNVLNREAAFERTHPTAYTVIMTRIGRGSATQGRITEVGGDYVCMEKLNGSFMFIESRECWLFDDISSVGFNNQ